MTAVNIDTGISACTAHLAMVSTINMNRAPNTIQPGITLRLSFPKIIRQICGMRSPTQPITPHNATILAVIRDAKVITTMRINWMLIPNARASCSDKESAFNRYRNKYNIMIPITIHVPPICNVRKDADDKLPINQNVMTGRTSFGSATYFVKDTRAENKEEMTIPANIIIIILGFCFFVCVKANTKTTATIPKNNALICTPNAPKPISNANAAPKDAPLAHPNVSGVAKGFENKA